ncbi:MAG TPA: RNA polymerase sigma factor [Candidatus Tenderia electrophaga]|uniref:RNA polymerase sigma factor n=1 Tax=Candidatus Tenderia electrophaga TaxID=1748243 RepID=A0A832J452_9GAMM|nr:RNA polymerase sigma factor [Candidatus Tenderia electrophaga]
MRDIDSFLAEVERRAYKMAYFAVNNRDDALDVVQEAMMKLVKRYGERSPEEWPPLFHRILQNQIQDYYRRSKVRSIIRSWFGGSDEDDQNEETTALAVGPGPLQQNLNNQSIQRLDDVIKELPLRQQQVFLLRAWEGLNVKETAMAMGCSDGSVKTHYSRAIRRLREELGEHWP